MKKTYTILLILIFVVFSCKKIPYISKENKVNLICLIDYSKSIPKTTLENYKSIIENEVLKNLSYSDKLIVLPIDYGSQTSSIEIFLADMESFKYKDDYASPLQEDELKQKKLLSILDSLKDKFDKSFSNSLDSREKYNKGTDIIGALRESNKYYESNSRNIVFIFSDMLQETENLNLLKLKNSNDVDKILDKSPKLEVKNLDVFVLTGEQPDIQISTFNNLKLFWTKYFEKNNLKLIEYNSGATSLISSKIKQYHEKEKIF